MSLELLLTESIALDTPATPDSVLDAFPKKPKARPKVDRLREAKVNLPGMTPARFQGNLGTCATFGVVACLEFFCQRDLSEACLTHETERQFGDCIAGMDVGQAMVGAKDNGIVDEEYWRYDFRQVCWTDPPAPDVSGRPRYCFDDIWLVYARDRQTILSSAGQRNERATSQEFVNLIKDVVGRFRVPVAISVPVFWRGTSHLDAGWENGDIHMPSPENLKLWVKVTPSAGDGWHCLPICGFDDATARFTFKNSWGAWWGRNGFGTLPYEYVSAFSSEAFAGTA